MKVDHCCDQVYMCAGEIECPVHGGFTVCCEHPENHTPVSEDYKYPRQALRQRFYLWRINNLPQCLFGERNLWKRVEGREHTREYHYYYCNAWCFITQQKFCRKPSKNV